MTADAVRGAGDGDIDLGAERMEDLMETLEVKGKKIKALKICLKFRKG